MATRTFKTRAGVRKAVDKTQLKYVEYRIELVVGGYVPEFVCLSDLEVKLVHEERFLIKGVK